MKRLPGWLALVALLFSPSARGLVVEGDKLVEAGRPIAVRGVWYPLHARRDGQAFDAADLVAWLRERHLNAVCVSVIVGPAEDEAAELLDTAATAGVMVGMQPLPAGDGRAVDRFVSRFDGHPGLSWWVLEDHREGLDKPVMLLPADGETGPSPGDAILGGWMSWLYRVGYTSGDAARGLARRRERFGGPMLAQIEAAPPNSVVTDGVLQPAAPHPDLYRDTRYRPTTAARLGGEVLLAPTPEQIRLATYAAVASGARGVLFDHAGHLCAGPDPGNGIDRAAEVAQLGHELSLIEDFIATGEVLRPPRTPVGVAGALIANGRDRLLLLWRDRRLDNRVVGGGVTSAFAIHVPVESSDDLAVYRLTPGRVEPERTDRRGNGLRIVVPDLDLTAAYVITADRLRMAAADEVARSLLPTLAEGRVAMATTRLRKSAVTLQRLEQTGHSVGSRVLLALAADRLAEAAVALRHGYQRTAIEQADATLRWIREAEIIEFETALLADLEPGQSEDDRLTYASLPWLWEPRPERAVAPYPIRPGRDLTISFEELAIGGIPARWRALRGYDQTVETVTAIEHGFDGSTRALRWLPRGDDPGLVALPFASFQTGGIELRIRCDTAPGGQRLILLAPGPERAPFGGVSIGSDGLVRGYPDSAATAALEPGWRRLAIRVDGQRLSAVWDDVTVTPTGGLPIGDGGVGAILFAKPPGADAVAIDIDRIVVTAER